MKARALNVCSALVILGAFFFICFFSQAEEAKLDFVTQPVSLTQTLGEVEVLPKGSLTWQKAEAGIRLTEGERIRTTEGSKAELTLEDGSFIRLKENTTLIINTTRQNVSSKTTERNLDLRVGEIMLELKKLKKGSTFEVETPTAVAAVRGTTYYVRTGTMMVNGVEKSYVEIYVDAGLVDYTNTLSGAGCIVPAGEGAIVFDDGTIEGPYPIPPSAQDAWRSGYDMKYDDGAGKKGMRGDEDEGEEGGGDDTGDDVESTTSEQEQSQDSANQERDDEQELYGFAKAEALVDTDGDGVRDKEDLFPNDPNRASGNDADGDGIDDEFDANDNDGPLGDTDGDGVANAADTFPNDPSESEDNDNDGIGNNADTDDDNDNYTDEDETDNGTNPLDASSTPPDNDKDYVSDLNDPDDDNDALSDADEAVYGTDPFDTDTDDDNLGDGDEVGGNTPFNYVTDPAKYDTDEDGVADGRTSPADRFPLDFFEQSDTDDDTPDYWQLSGLGDAASNLFMPGELYPGDFEDLFPDDPAIDGDGIYTDEFGAAFYGRYFNDRFGNPVVVRGYGSRYEMRQAALNHLLEIENIKADVSKDINDMIDDIRTRQFEAFKEEMFDHQVGKVMTDRWGNRVRVEEYVFKHPTKGVKDTVEVLALSLRTAGPNAGISSYAFEVRFDRSIEGANLRSLPWDSYMGNPVVSDYEWVSEFESEPDDDDQLIVYGEFPFSKYPCPQTFSIEVRNPYSDSVRATEDYSPPALGRINDGGTESDLWYQLQTGEGIFINGDAKEYAETESDDWGEDWNQANRYTFLDEYTDDSWLMGVFYLINDDGTLVDLPGEVDERDYLGDLRGLRDCLNPDFNLEMVFLSSEFGDTPDELPEQIANREEMPDYAYESELYNAYRTIDVITIPEITTPYRAEAEREK